MNKELLSPNATPADQQRFEDLERIRTSPESDIPGFDFPARWQMEMLRLKYGQVDTLSVMEMIERDLEQLKELSPRDYQRFTSKRPISSIGASKGPSHESFVDSLYREVFDLNKKTDPNAYLRDQSKYRNIQHTQKMREATSLIHRNALKSANKR